MPYPTGHYVFTYDGTGSANFGGDAIAVTYPATGRVEFNVTTANVRIIITITSTSATDHLRNFPLFLASDEGSYQKVRFRQAFLDLLAPFSIIRFMDWSGVSLHAYVGISGGSANRTRAPSFCRRAPVRPPSTTPMRAWSPS